MKKRQRPTDRLSALPDETLQRILCHLKSRKAVRTSALSRRWHHVYAAVPIVDLLDPKSGNDIHDLPDQNRGNHRYKAKVCFDQQVTGAILSKAPGTPIRIFRLNAFNPPRDLLDQWIIIAASSGVEEIDVKLRYREFSSRRLCPFVPKTSEDFDRCDKERYVKTQHHLFSCPTLRRLCLTNWTLDIPMGVVMSSLDTLCLTRIMDPEYQLQQLLSNCPRLADLTLQECPSLRKITVPSAHLRSFAMICCHHARRVKLSSSCLQSLQYKGGLPCKSLFKLANHSGVVALNIEICEDLSEKKPAEFAPATKLIRRCMELAYLHLSFCPSMAYCSSLFTNVVPCLQHLRQLALQCCLHEDHDIHSVAVLLRETHNLEVLSLFPLGPKTPIDDFSLHSYDSESDTVPEDAGDDGVDYTEREDDGDYGVDYTEPEDYGVDYTEHEDYGVDYTEHEDYGVDYTEPEDYGVDYTEPEDYGVDYTGHQDDGDYGFDYTEPEDGGVDYTEHEDDGVDYSSQLIDSFWPMHIRCLDDKLRRINIQEYSGQQLEKILAKFLLSKAAALEEFSVTLTTGCSQNKCEIAKELRSWQSNKNTRVTVN